MSAWLNGQAIASGLAECHSIHNFSVDGATTNDLLARFPAEAKALACGDSSVFLFALGINDSSVVLKTGENRVPLCEFQTNLLRFKTITDSLPKEGNLKLAFMGLFPFPDGHLDPCPWDLEIAY